MLIKILYIFSYIKHWDLRKSYRQVNGNKEPLPLAKYFDYKHDTQQSIGYADMVVNSESTRLYASGMNNIIHCYSLESPQRSTYFTLTFFIFFIIC